MRKLFRSFAVLAVVAGLISAQLGQLQAQSNAIVITPRKDYSLKPGETVTDTLTITNQDRNLPLQLALKVVDFESQDETGTPQLLRQDNAPQTPWSVREFVQIPAQVSIEAGGSASVPVTVRVPEGTGAGSYYSAIEYSSVTDAEENRLNISASTVTLMFVKVPGTAKQQLTFEQFGTFVPDNNGTGGSFAGLFFNSRPKVMAYRLKNDGNIAEQPSGSIVIKNFFGKEVYTVADANPKDQLALRGQTRRFEACIVAEQVQQRADNGTEINTVTCGDTNFGPGRYTAELSVLYGENGNETREITAKASFWYLPWWFVGLVVLGIGIVVTVIMLIVRKIKDLGTRRTRKRRF
jgi:hypothetical protein